MNLSELLKKISPLPWLTTPEGITNIIKDANGSCIAMEATDCGDPIAQEDAAYITHAANTLPELVEALQKIADKTPRDLQADFADMQYIAEKALRINTDKMAKKVRF